MTRPRIEVPPRFARDADDDAPPTRRKHPAARRPASVVADPTADVVCPNCGTTSVVDGVHRQAHDFCGSCDYPLFWAAPRRDSVPAEILGELSLRRPGAPATTELRRAATSPAPVRGPEGPAVVPAPWWQEMRVECLIGLSALAVLLLDIVAIAA